MLAGFGIERKEILDAYPAYNLVRTIIVEAAAKHAIELRSSIFKGAIQTLKAIQPVMDATRFNPLSAMVATV